MSTEYSKSKLNGFVAMQIAKSLINPNTGNGYKVAAAALLEQVGEDEDVRTVDLDVAVRRYNNSHPNELSPKSLGVYKRRVQRLITDFVKYTENPAAFKGRGRSPLEMGNGEKKKDKSKTEKGANTTITPATGNLSLSGQPAQLLMQPSPRTGLTLDYPLRTDFLAQVIVPRDMKAEEARRLSRFIMTLAQDFNPEG
jgi:hypothetical protein